LVEKLFGRCVNACNDCHAHVWSNRDSRMGRTCEWSGVRCGVRKRVDVRGGCAWWVGGWGSMKKRSHSDQHCALFCRVETDELDDSAILDDMRVCHHPEPLLTVEGESVCVCVWVCGWVCARVCGCVGGWVCACACVRVEGAGRETHHRNCIANSAITRRGFGRTRVQANTQRHPHAAPSVTMSDQSSSSSSRSSGQEGVLERCCLLCDQWHSSSVWKWGESFVAEKGAHDAS
jgi:hypothetical protein